MARPLRALIPGGWYHVMNRGNRRQALFLTDDDRRRFLGLVSELPDRFRIEVHAFVLMDNHYHLLVRTPEANLSEGIRWLHVTFSCRWNWVHEQVGHLFQGRFKAVLIQDLKGVSEVARYLHLNPVRVGGLGLDKTEQRRARVSGGEEPSREQVAQRLAVLEQYLWSSWRVYSGAETRPSWLETGALEASCGGRGRREQRLALRQYTEAPVRQGRLESPWDRLVAGWVLGDRDFAQSLLRGARANAEEQTEARRLARETKVSWAELVRAAEKALDRPWSEMVQTHGDWGRDGVLFVATRYGGCRLAEVMPHLPGLKYQAAAQGVRRFRAGLAEDPGKARFVAALRSICQ